MDDKDAAQADPGVREPKARRPADARPAEREAADYDPELVEALDALDGAAPEHTATSAADAMAWLRRKT
jgi:aryl-alcohol dehydrogenase-like predicted oxidoreductase